jgi:DNA (cytosine-5)-methyltransferase 1
MNKWAYYNDSDPFVCAWARELIKAGLAPDGEVDERSICEVQPEDIRGFTQCHFFCGILGWSYALRLAGWPDDRPVWTGSCPCQPFSSAGKRKGVADKRHLWPEMFRLIRECRPPVVFGEQVEAAIRLGWLDGVFADLEREGYACGAAVLPAACVGAPHIRSRIWWVADAERIHGRLPDEQRTEVSETERCGADGRLADACDRRREQCQSQQFGRIPESCEEGETGGLGDADPAGSQGRRLPGCECADQRPARSAMPWNDFSLVYCRDGKARRTQSGVQPLVAGLSKGMGQGGDNGEPDIDATAEARVMRLRGYGNSIVAQLAAEFILAYREAINDGTV